MRLLLAEDDPALGASMKHALVKAGYVVDRIETAGAAVAAVYSQEYAAILLDLKLRASNGLDALRSIRAAPNDTPVLIVTANDARDCKLEGLNAGADDYVVKPFDLDELLARIRVHIRRRTGRASNVLSVGNVSLDLSARLVMRDEQVIPVTAKELKVLTVLMRNTGRFVSRSDLESALYDDSADIESNTIEVAIYGLRRKLSANLIITARGLGYMIPRSA